MRIAWTAFNSSPRIIDFNGYGITQLYITMDEWNFNFMYRDMAGTANITGYYFQKVLNTVYDIAVVYSPAAKGTVKIWFNGALVTTKTNAIYYNAAADMSFAHTYVGKSSNAAADYLSANIYYLDVYNRALTNQEAASIPT